MTIRDITEQKRAENALREAGEFNRQIIESAQEGVIVYGQDLKYQVWNPFMERFTGLLAGEVLGRHPLEVFPFLREFGVMAIIEKALTGETSEAVRFPFHAARTGLAGWASAISAPLRNASGEIIGVIGTVRDITEHVRADEAIQAAAREWSTSFDAMSDGISIHNTDHTIINANKSLCQLLGKTADEVIGKKCHQIFHGKDSPITDCPFRKLIGTTQKVHAELFAPVLNKWLSLSTSPIFDDSGCLIRIVHTVRDITEQRNIENQLRHAQKMEAVGTLAGGIAHDFNNILNAILGFGTMVLDGLGGDNPLRMQMNEVLTAAERAANLTKRLLVFSRKQVVDIKLINVNETVLATQKMLALMIRENIEFNMDLTDGQLSVVADAGQIEQVLMNLVTNARDAMPNGGRLTIGTGLQEFDDEYVATYGYGRPGKYALITVADTGHGMDAETQKKIFEPFFTTKGIGEGTGLGLAISYGIIKQHSGYITVCSEPGTGNGTIFTIYLPLIEDAAPLRKETEATISAKGGIETILVAEDDAALRKLSKIVLESSGYRVITAEDGEDAIRIFMENRDRIHLVMLDMVMPKKNGKEVSEVLRKVRPGIKILFVSGYTMDIIKSQELIESGFDFIQKPISPKYLLKKVRDILDRTS